MRPWALLAVLPVAYCGAHVSALTPCGSFDITDNRTEALTPYATCETGADGSTRMTMGADSTATDVGKIVGAAVGAALKMQR